MNVVSRYFLYLLDCGVMLAIIGVQLLLFRGEWPLSHDPDHWLGLLLEGHRGLYLTTLCGAAAYWTIMDFDPRATSIRGSRVVRKASGQLPDLGLRFSRSLIKAFTLFGGGLLLLFALCSAEHRFLHDYLVGTERVKE